MVTRAELYSLLSLICFLLAMALLGVAGIIAGIEPLNTLRFIGYIILFLTALGLGLYLAILAARERRREAEQRDNTA